MVAERAQLLPLVEQHFELAELSFLRVDELGCACADQFLLGTGAAWHDSGGAALPKSRRSALRGLPKRCYERHQQVLDLEHYVDVPNASRAR
jgi:hypothetical protein